MNRYDPYICLTMHRKNFISTLLSASAGIMTLSSFKSLNDLLKEDGNIMPVLFIGHGSPMNGIESNIYSRRWEELGTKLPIPKAVICVSAHWLTQGTSITAMPNPRTIHDFGGFPDELFKVEYPAPGDPALAEETKKLITSVNVGLDHDWGLDHGTWTVVRRMYPSAEIPVLQLSIDFYKPGSYHFNLAKELSVLRRKGVLIIGSGNMVHNLRMVAWDKLDQTEYGYDWAIEMNDLFKKKILSGDYPALMNYSSLGKSAELAIPTPDHYFPLLYALGLQEAKDDVSFFNDHVVGGSLTMTSVLIGRNL